MTIEQMYNKLLGNTAGTSDWIAANAETGLTLMNNGVETVSGIASDVVAMVLPEPVPWYSDPMVVGFATGALACIGGYVIAKFLVRMVLADKW